MNRDTPTISASSGYSSNTLGINSVLASGSGNFTFSEGSFGNKQGAQHSNQTLTYIIPTGESTLASTPSRRLVRVFIADPNEFIPLDKAVLYSGEEKFTDLTDQELFFEIEINALLSKHNEMRASVVNKALKDRAAIEYLEPARIRDLKMTVVTIASF